MRKSKCKVGDTVEVQHVGKCEVRKVVEIDGVFEYIVAIGASVFQVEEGEIMEVSDEKAGC